MNVIFLDFDGVVNTLMWKCRNGKYSCEYNFPEDGSVNNYQAVQWVSEFCQEYGYSIVISSTWRNDGLDVCKKCLVNGGLREGIKVIGVTPILNKQRGDEISAWLKENPEVNGYLIFDDDRDMTVHMDRLVLCDSFVGFGLDQYSEAVTLHCALNN